MSDILKKINNRKKAGTIAWGEKTQNYLEEKSRISVEEHTNTPVLFFEIDYEKSHKNFYGEILHKIFKNNFGVPLEGTVEIVAEEISYDEGGIINKGNVLNFGCFISMLKEKKVNPKWGDYLYAKNKWYSIFDKTALDANETAVAYDKATTIKFRAAECTDEEINFDPKSQGSLDDIQTYLEQKPES